MTPFAALRTLAGLSIADAAGHLGSRIDTVKSWSAGRSTPPPGVIAEIRDLIRRQERAAGEALAAIAGAGPDDDVELGYPADDAEAAALGWSCTGAWWAMAARVVAGTDRTIRLVPRGSTPATAAATDAQDRVRKFAPRARRPS